MLNKHKYGKTYWLLRLEVTILCYQCPNAYSVTDDLTNVGMFESSDVIGPIPTHQSHKAQSLQTGDDKLLQDKAVITPYHETIGMNDKRALCNAASS